MPDSKKSEILIADPGEASLVGEDEVCVDDYARVIRDRTTTLIIIVRWHTTECVYEILEEGSDLILERTTGHGNAHRLADMYLDGFREGYDRGYAAAQAEYAARYTAAVTIPDNYRTRIHLNHSADPNPGPAESLGRDRDNGEGQSEGDRPGGQR